MHTVRHPPLAIQCIFHVYCVQSNSLNSATPPSLSHPTVQPASPGDSRDHWADWQKPQQDAAVFIFLHEQAVLSISHDSVK